MASLWFLFAAYTVVWAVVLGFVLSLYLRERSLRREVSALKELLDRRERPASPGAGAER
ncbi:MAG: CcmD family protein [Dehalococcoidia bacterium]|nr:CcmD family protein [Dehalococcoidia bacterium]